MKNALAGASGRGLGHVRDHDQIGRGLQNLRREQASACLVGNEGVELQLLEKRDEPFGRPFEIKRHIGAAGPASSKHADIGFDAACPEDADAPRAGASRERAGQLGCFRRKLAVADLLLPDADRASGGPIAGLFRERQHNIEACQGDLPQKNCPSGS